MLPRSIQTLIEEFSRLPGIGPKSAQRLAMHLLRTPEVRTRPLGEAVINMRNGVKYCTRCWNISDVNPCSICTNPGRDATMLCVVEDILDVMAIEKTGEYKGLYHVLHGALSPIEGIGPEQLKIGALMERMAQNEQEPLVENRIQEVILATNPGLEGEATAMYLTRHLKPYSIKVTRIARGLPVGADLEYADQVTITRALEGRQEY